MSRISSQDFTPGSVLQRKYLFPVSCKKVWTESLTLIWGSLTRGWAQPGPVLPRGSHTFPLQGCPCLGAPGEERWHFRAEELEGTERITGASQKQLRAFSDLLPFTWLPVSLKKVYFFFFFSFFSCYPHEAFFPMSHPHHKEITVWLKVLLPCLESTFFQWEIGNELNSWGDSLFTILTWDVFLPLTLREKKIIQ